MQMGCSGPRLVRLGDPSRGENDAVTVMAFSWGGNLLVEGRAKGDVAFWELRRGTWESIKVIKGGRAYLHWPALLLAPLGLGNL